MENLTYQQAKEVYNLTASGIKMMLGDERPGEGAMAFNVDFSVDKLSLAVLPEHETVVRALIEILEQQVQRRSTHFEARWLLINKLLLVQFGSGSVSDQSIYDSSPSLAALVAFPLLEELAKHACGIWDDDGLLLEDISKEYGLNRIDSKGETVPHTYKAGQRIVNFSHKLYLMESRQEKPIEDTLKSLNARLSAPIIQGGEATAPMYEKLQKHRDLWAHGREFQGWEALFVNLLISLIYWGRYMLSVGASES